MGPVETTDTPPDPALTLTSKQIKAWDEFQNALFRWRLKEECRERDLHRQSNKRRAALTGPSDQ